MMPEKRESDKPNFWIPVLFLLVTSIFLYPIIMGKVFFPGDLLYKMPPWFFSDNSILKEVIPANNQLLWDQVTAFYPWYTFIGRAFSEGYFPLWNPFVMAGSPFLANWQSGVFALENIVFYFFKTTTAMNLSVFLKVFLALNFTYLFLRKLNLSREASVFGAFTYAFSAFFVVWLGWPQTRVAIWLPLILFTVEHLLERPNIKRIGFVSLATAAAVFAGHPGTLMQTFIILVIYIAFRLYAQSKKRFRTGTYLFFGLVLGLGISSILLLPGIEMIRNSYQYSLRGMTDYLLLGLEPKYLAVLFFPYFYGHIKSGVFVGGFNFNEISSYVGLLPLFLSASSVSLANRIKSHWPLIILAFFAAIMVFGLWPQSILTKLPFISMQPTQRYIFILTFSLATLGAFGFDALFRQENEKRRLLVISLAFVLLMVFIYFNVHPKVKMIYKYYYLGGFLVFFISIGVYFIRNIKQARWLLIFLLFIDLFLFGFKLNSYTKQSMVYAKNPVTDFLKKKQNNEEPFRVLPLGDSAMPNSLMVYGIEDLRGRDALISKRQYDFFELITDKNIMPQQPNFLLPNIIKSDIIDFLNTKYVISEVVAGNDMPKNLIGSNALTDLNEGLHGQSFVSKKQFLSGFSVVLGTSDKLNYGVFRFKLLDDKGKVVRQGSRLARQAKNRKYFHFFFKPIKGSQNKRFTFLIESSKAAKVTKTMIFINTNDVYKEGERYFNNAKRDGDLMFNIHHYRSVLKLTPVFTHESLTVYENKNVLPRAYAVDNLLVVGNTKKALGLLKDEKIDYKKQVIIDKKPSYGGEIKGFKGQKEVKILSYKPNEIIINANLETKSIIVVSDNYYPGWKAFIDGKEAPIRIANTSFRAIALNKGKHRLRLSYQPASFRYGMYLSLLSLLIVFGFIGQGIVRRRNIAK